MTASSACVGVNWISLRCYARMKIRLSQKLLSSCALWRMSVSARGLEATILNIMVIVFHHPLTLTRICRAGEVLLFEIEALSNDRNRAASPGLARSELDQESKHLFAKKAHNFIEENLYQDVN